MVGVHRAAGREDVPRELPLHGADQAVQRGVARHGRHRVDVADVVGEDVRDGGTAAAGVRLVPGGQVVLHHGFEVTHVCSPRSVGWSAATTVARRR
ncbi:hypothetical protein GCM10020358_09740 [Amorphoplanes nipponensis]